MGRDDPFQSFGVAPTKGNSASNKLPLFVTLTRNVDIRILLIGSILPDLIDKPLGYLFRDILSSGRTLGHTLLFLILISIVGFYLYFSHRRTSIPTLSFGTLTHLVLDRMWRIPSTLFWPIYGFSFAKEDVADWIPKMLSGLMTDSEIYVAEILGAAILCWFILVLIRRRTVYDLLIRGQIK